MFKQNQDIFKLLLGEVSEGVLVVDENQIIVEANNSAKKMFGYVKEPLIKQPLNKIIPKDYISRHENHFNNFIKKNKPRQMGQGLNIFGKRKDESIFPLEVGLNPFTINGKKYVMALTVDISIRKQQEQTIKNLNITLEQKVRARTTEIENAVKELKLLNLALYNENKKRIKAEDEAKSALNKERELNDLKTQFLSLVSHEFKTPLSGVLTSAILLSKYKLNEQQGERDKHIKTITDKVHYLNNILSDFLSVEKIENGKIKYSPSNFKLCKVINEVIESAKVNLKDGQKIKYQKDIYNLSLFQDKKIVALILSNLVNNAIKYSSENSSIILHVIQNKVATIFKVKDQGIGIPKKDQKNIFNRYFRAENAVLTQGTGIGLNIVKNHLESLGGSISFKSEENKETCFTVKIPNKKKL